MTPSRSRKMVGRTTGLRGDARPWRRTRRARRASGDCKKKSMSPHFANGFRVRVRALSTVNQPTSSISSGLRWKDSDRTRPRYTKPRVYDGFPGNPETYVLRRPSRTTSAPISPSGRPTSPPSAPPAPVPPPPPPAPPPEGPPLFPGHPGEGGKEGFGGDVEREA